MIIPASRLVDLCAEAYDVAPDVQGRGFNEDIHLIIREPVPGVTVIAARGSTRDIKDWLHDFDAVPAWSDMLGGYMHSGVLEAANSIYEPLASRSYGKNRIVFTGHSLGGGIALVLGALFALGGVVPDVVTFGAPRIGMSGFAKLYKTKGIYPMMYRHGADPVPQVPRFLTWTLDWYRHPGMLRQLGHDCGFPQIADHFLAYYKRAVVKWEDSFSV